MTTETAGIDPCAQDTKTGDCAIVAALVIALHDNGILSTHQYSSALERLWLAMPEEEAVGETGEVIEHMLEMVAARADTGSSFEPKPPHEPPQVLADIANNDAIPRPTPSRALFHALCGPALRD